MRAELRKLMVLPTPRWTVAGLLASVLIATVVVAITGAGEDALALSFGVSVPTWIGAIVLGVWMSGMEYGQKTMRRTLTRNPNRLEVVFSKLTVVVLATIVLTLAVTLIAIPLFSLASTGHDLTVPAGDTLKNGLADVPGNVVDAIAGFCLGLLTRSMAGGMTITLAFFLVVDSLLAEIPKAGDFTLSAVSAEIFQKIAGNEIAQTDLDVQIVRAVAITLIWVAGFVGLSTLRFLKTDIE